MRWFRAHAVSGLLMVAATLAVAGCAAADASSRDHWRPPAVLEGRMGSRMVPGGTIKPGAVVPASDIYGKRAGGVEQVFADRRHGYSLAFIGNGIYPARSVDGGEFWRVDGPPLAVADAAGPGNGAAGAIGVANASTAFAWGGASLTSVVAVTTDGGRSWWVAYEFPGVVLNVGSEGNVLVAYVDGSVGSGSSRHSGLWAYELRADHRWTYFAAL